MKKPGALPTGVFLAVCISIAMAIPFLHRFIPPLTPTMIGTLNARVPGVPESQNRWDWLEPNEGWITWFPNGLPNDRFPVRMVRAKTSSRTIPGLVGGAIISDHIWIFDPVPDGQVGLLQYVTAGFQKTSPTSNAGSPSSSVALVVQLNGEPVLFDERILAGGPGYRKDINMWFPSGAGASVRTLLGYRGSGTAFGRITLNWSVWPDPLQEFGTMQDEEFTTVSTVIPVTW